MNQISRKLKFENCFCVDRSGKRGGLAILWNSEIEVQIKSFSKHHIDAKIHDKNGKHLRCMSVYGHPEMGQRKHTWMLMRHLASLSSSHWLCFGDCNEILHSYEKTSGNAKDLNVITEFRKAPQDCNLVDVGYRGFT